MATENTKLSETDRLQVSVPWDKTFEWESCGQFDYAFFMGVIRKKKGDSDRRMLFEVGFRLDFEKNDRKDDRSLLSTISDST